MKRIFALAMAAMLLLCGCGKDNKKEEGGSKAAVKLGDVTVTVSEALTDEMKTALGEPIGTEEAPSCHYEGMDTVYVYDGFRIQTYRNGDTDAVAVITVESADHPTDKGVKVGDSTEAAKDAYGEAAEETAYYIVYDLTDNVTLTFELSDGKVATILYEEKA